MAGFEEKIDQTGGESTDEQRDDLKSLLTQAVIDSDAAAVKEPEEKVVGEEKPVVGEEGIGEKAPEAAAKDEKVVEEKKPDDQALEPNLKWSEDNKEIFKGLPPAAQKILLEREKAMQAAYTKKTTEIANFRKEYEPIDKMFVPYKDVMKSKGLTVEALVQGWANVELALANGKGIDVVHAIIDGYKINPLDLVKSLTKKFGGSAEKPAAEEAAKPDAAKTESPINLPPELTNRLSKVEEYINSRSTADRESVAATVNSTVETFRDEKDAKGELLHPHFSDVESDMAALFLANKQMGGQPLSLQQLYDKAVYANPTVREKVLTARRQSEENARTAEARAKAAKARKAGSSVTGSPGTGQTPSRPNSMNKSGSIRDDLLAAAEEVSQ